MSHQQNQQAASAAFTFAPMGAHQFYQMAQHHAIVNSAFGASAVAYDASSDAYAPLMHFGAYNVPQHMVYPTTTLETAPYAEPATAWNGFGYGAAGASLAASAHPAPLYASVDLVSPHAYTSSTVSSSTSPLYSPASTPSTAASGLSAHAVPVSVAPSSSVVAAASVAPSTSAAEQLSTTSEHISDAPFADEHKWRKYGQKQVKRSPYPRNYYKCTVPSCPAKKHLEKFWDPAVNRERCRTIYIGEHVHPVAVSPQVFASTQQDFQNNVLAQAAKTRSSGDFSQQHASDAAEIATQQRLVVECGTQVDENEDGYYWRKYGQKSVKGSSTPRQYYRCRVLNCAVKKTVEASPKGNTIVTYDGCHNHEPGMIAAPLASSAVRTALPQQQHQQPFFSCALPIHHIQQQQQQQYQLQHFATVQASPMMVKFQPDSPSSSSVSSTPYPTSSVESPSSITTDDEESYFSEPSPKRSFKDEDVNYSEQIHQFAADAPPAETWYSLWDNSAELITH